MRLSTFLMTVVVAVVAGLIVMRYFGQFAPTVIIERPKPPPAPIINDNRMDAVVIIKGARGAGTGFFARQNGKTYLFTNIHVLMGEEGVRFTDHAGKQYKPAKIEVASDRDIARLEMKNEPATILEIETPKNVECPVAVCGNPEGQDVLRSVSGKLKGIGPTKIETDATFVKGHSGSPILDNDGRVIGIASFIMSPNVNWMTTNTPFMEVRRFGYRLDTVPEWMPVDVKRFAAQGRFIDSRREQMEAFAEMLCVWFCSPFWMRLPTSDTFSPTFNSWIDVHNLQIDSYHRRLDQANEEGSYTALQDLSRQILSHFKRNVDELNSEANRLTMSPYETWAVPFFADEWNDLRAGSDALRKFIKSTSTFWSSADPVKISTVYQ